MLLVNKTRPINMLSNLLVKPKLSIAFQYLFNFHWALFIFALVVSLLLSRVAFAGDLIIQSGGQLKGSGTISGGVTSVLAGGSIEPGSGVACIATDDLTLTTGGTLAIEINGTNACTEYDQIQVTGAVTLGSATLSLESSSYTFHDGDVITIIENDSSDAINGTFNGLAEGDEVDQGSFIFYISYLGGDGNDVTLTAAKQTQTIVFKNINNQQYTTYPMSLFSSASSGLDVIYSSETPSVCTVSGNEVSFVTVGICSITASQAGDDTYQAADDVTQTITISQSSQEITFAAPTDKNLGDADFSLTATSDSGLTVSFASSTSTICSVTDSTVSLLGAGTCSITASQNGNTNYQAAPDVIHDFSVFDVTAPVITLLGDAAITIAQHSVYSDAGASANDNVDGNLSASIQLTGSVDTSTVGVYTLSYNVSDAAGNDAIEVTRTVTVTDQTIPVIKLTGDSSTTVAQDSTYIDAGATATDNNDGDITASIVTVNAVDTSTVGSYIVTYDVFDAAGNAATQVTRTVTVIDQTVPVIVLNGDSSVTVAHESTYTDAGATASDNNDGDITSSLVTVNSVDTSTIGTYTVTYNVSDAAGNNAIEVTRTVDVTDQTVPVITVPNALTVAATDAEGTAKTSSEIALFLSSASAVDTNDSVIASVENDGPDVFGLGTTIVTFTATDSAGNTGSAQSTVTVSDQHPPIISLIGDASITINLDDTYTDAGASALDNVDGDISGSIVVSGAVNSSVLGTYLLNYDVSDAAGNAAVTVSREINVIDPDNDGDGIGDSVDPDDDNDGVPDDEDAFPNDATESVDTDADGAGDNSDIDADGDGLIEIENIAALNEIRNHLDGTGLFGSSFGCPDSGCIGFELTNNLNFDTNNDGELDSNDVYWNGAEGWIALGSSITDAFSATFDGNNYSIANLYMDTSVSDLPAGLFGHINGATIKNIHLTGDLTQIKAQNGGFLVYEAKGSEYLISNCSVTGVLNGTGINGGIAGLTNAGRIENCHVAANITATGTDTGGLIGRVEGIVALENISFSGTISGTALVGGLVGTIRDFTLSSSYVIADIDASIGNVGGLIGSFNQRYGLSSTIESSFAMGSITAPESIGGLLGYIYAKTGGTSLDINNSYASNQLTGSGDVGGIIGTLTGNADINLNFVYASGANSVSSGVGGLADGSWYSDSPINVSDSYWDYESTGQSSTYLDAGLGLSTNELQCPKSSNDDNCSLIYTYWSSSLWNFGDATQYPALIFDGQVLRDTDGDRVWDSEDAFPLDPTETTDTDGDGVGDNSDAFPNDATETTDTDGDGIGNNADTDDDGDGIEDAADAFPEDATESVDTDSDGTGDNSDVDLDNDGLIEINSLDDLAEISNHLDGTGLYGSSAGCPSSGCNGFELTTDLDFDTNSDGVIDANDDYWNGGEGWEPIGSQYSPFAAYFEGNNYTIANLMINRDSTDEVGLFAGISGATLSNLSLSGELTNITGRGNVSALVGAALHSNNLIENCSITASISGTSRVGLVAGYFAGGTVEGCTASGSVIASSNNTGGLIGYGAGPMTMESSNFTGTVSASDIVAGLIGFASDVDINESYAVVDVNATSDDAAGLVGYWSPVSDVSVSVSKSFAIGSVSGASYYSAGLIGEFSGRDGYPLVITDSYASVSVDGGDFLSAFIAGVWGDIELNRVYATGTVTGSHTAGLVQEYSGAITVTEAYWDTESTGQTSTFGEQGTGLTTTELQCPTEPGDATCTTSAFTTWSTTNWNFGDSNQYPGLIIDGFVYLDSDGDGTWDSEDDLPFDASETMDSDGDGVGDNSDTFPSDSSETTDTDGDGIGNNADTDDDGDGIEDAADAFPEDATESVDTDSDGTGDNSDVDLDNDGLIEINSLDDLAEISNHLDGTGLYGSSAGCPSSGCNGFELTTDLDFDTNSDGVIDANDDYWNGGEGWEPIGSQYSPFAAYFEGNNYTIANLMINRDSTDEVGLFAGISGATLSNLSLSGELTNITGRGNVSALVGAALHSNNLIENCSITASISGTSRVGLVAGYFAGGTVEGCTASGSVIASSNNTGGLIGYGAGPMTMESSNFTGTVSASDIVAGLIGFASDVDINESYAVVDVNATSDDAAGLVGYWSPVSDVSVSVSKSFAIGSVSGASYYSAGLIGEFSGRDGYPLVITDSYASVSVDGGDFLSAFIAGVWGDIELNRVYATGTVTGSHTAGLVQEYSGAITVTEAYWDTESTGQTSTFGEQGTGLTTTELQCPTEPGDATCTTSAFTTWSTTNWNFGDSNQYPGLIIDGFVYLDSDGDGTWDSEDDLPFDASDTLDTDDDGVGDNSDAFPSDASETTDTDGDGVGDNSDAFPSDASETTDTDGDGVGDNSDAFPSDTSETTDTDGDGVGDNSDAFPSDASETTDTDGDGVGDNSDAFPSDASETTDTDGDGVGNNSDAFPSDASETTDTDGDGVGNNSDAFPSDASETTDTDGDGVGDNSDAFPSDASETTDTDGDGVGDNSDAFPYDPSESTDSDGDGIGDNAAAADNEAPIIGGVENVEVEATGELTRVELEAPTVTDNITASPTIESDLTEPLALGEHIVTWTATDEVGNQATKEQKVTVVDTTAPEYTELAPFIFEASGVNTDLTDLLSVTAFDLVDGELTATIEGETSLASGRHKVSMVVTDLSGNSAKAQVDVDILPEVSIASSMDVEAGDEYKIGFELSGLAPSYPVIVAYQLLRNDELITQAESQIEEGLAGEIALSIPADTVIADELTIALTGAEQAYIGTFESIQLQIVEGNVAPQLQLTAMQLGVSGKVIDPDLGLVTLRAIIDDTNVLDSHDINWRVEGDLFSDEQLDNDGFTFELNPSLLANGAYTISATATENNTADAFSVTKSIQLVIEHLAPLSDELDADQDGIVDSEEGYGDSDGDGIADYLDSDESTSRLPVNDTLELMHTAPGLTLSLGSFVQKVNGAKAQFASLSLVELAQSVGSNDASIDDADYQVISPIYNFVIDGLTQAGDSASVVIQLSKPLPADVVYRKYNRRDGWYQFVEDHHNALSSAPVADNGECPAVNDSSYTLGLSEGHRCVQITLEDGGANDGDFTANGAIEDPGAFAVKQQAVFSGALMLSETQRSIDESTSKLVITVSRINGDDGEVSIDYQFVDGTAINGEDYQAQGGTLVFTDGEADKDIIISLENDSVDEVDEAFIVELFNPINTHIEGGNTIEITILDDDASEERDSANDEEIEGQYRSGGSMSICFLILILAATWRRKFV